MYSLLIGISAFAFSTKEIDEKLVQSFKSNYPKAEEAKWHELDDAYVVNFVENGIRSKITFKKDRSDIVLTRYYQEQHLPYHIKSKLKKKFADKKIFGIIENSSVTEQGEQLAVEYYIKLEDEKSWTTVKVDNNGGVSVTEKFRKKV